MTDRLDAPRGADLLIGYIFPDGTDLTGCTAVFSIYTDRGGTTLVTVDGIANDNGSSITIDQNVLTLNTKAADIDSLPIDDDPTSPKILTFDLILTTTIDQVTKLHGGTFRVQPYGAKTYPSDGRVYANIGGQEVRIEVAPATFDAAVLSSVATFATSAEQAAYTSETKATEATEAADVAVEAKNQAVYAADGVVQVLEAGGAVRFDAPQGLNTDQAVQARENIEVYSITDVDTVTSELDARLNALEDPLIINSFAATPPIAEVGSTVTPTLDWDLSVDPVEQEIDYGINAVVPVTTRTISSGAAITTDRTWTLTVNNGFNDVTAQASTLFQRKRYYGVTTKAPNVAMTNSEVLALTGEFDTNYSRSGLTFNCTGGRYPAIWWPASFGQPTSITVGGLAFTAFTIETQTVTNASGSAVSYYVLRFNDIQTGSNIQVSI